MSVKSQDAEQGRLLAAVRLAKVKKSYADSAYVERHGINVVVVSDHAGMRLDDLTNEVERKAEHDGSGVWDDLVSATRSVRWKNLMCPVPPNKSPVLRQVFLAADQESKKLRPSVAPENVLFLNEVAAALETARDGISTVGTVLRRSLLEAQSLNPVVVVSNSKSRVATEEWLSDPKFKVFTPGELRRSASNSQLAYVVGPPLFFDSSLFTAPAVEEMIFVVPSWFRDWRVPTSVMSNFVDKPIVTKVRIQHDGDECAPEPSGTVDRGMNFVPEFDWQAPARPDGEQRDDELVARQVLLSGGYSTWLDDGERIRCLDPDQPMGERVGYERVERVHSGTYLLLREGETEPGAPIEAALELLGEQRQMVFESQEAWKAVLRESLDDKGHRKSEQELQLLGVRAYAQVREWARRDLIRPSDDGDFKLLLGWLGLEVTETFRNATLLRKYTHRASSLVREKLEEAVSTADLSALDREGHLRLEFHEDGFSGILATKILAVSPDEYIVHSNKVRTLQEDRRVRWLE